ncbi:MAG: helix-turn-helix domain-containing protein [Alkalispirochaeta sp.]
MPELTRNHVQYFVPPAEVRALGVHCLDAGAAWTPPGFAYPLVPEQHPRQYRAVAGGGRRLAEYQVVYISRGAGWFENARHGTVPVAAGTVFLLRPGDWHRYAPDGETGWQEYWIGFSGAHVDRVWRMLGLGETRAVMVGPGAQEDLNHLFGRGLRLSVQPQIAEQVELAGILQELLGRIARALQVAETDGQSDHRFERARELMLERLHGHIETTHLEQRVGCSRSTLHRLFMQRTGTSPYRYYLGLKVNAAKWELAHTGRSIKEIARTYGFSDQYHFSRVFYEIAAVRPSRWRADHWSAGALPATSAVEQTR